MTKFTDNVIKRAVADGALITHQHLLVAGNDSRFQQAAMIKNANAK